MRPRLPVARVRQARTYLSDRVVQPNDTLLLKQRGDRSPRWRLTPPLKPGSDKPIRLQYGATVTHDELLGRRMLDGLTDSKGRDVVVYEASLANHVVHSARSCAPIYPHDASTIVNMMDLHVDRPGETDETEPFEIFEAGTGAGSLTIQIARALHAANPPLSRALRDAIPSTPLKPQDDTTHQTVNLMALDLPEDLAAEAAAYTSSRRAVLHTLDHKTSHSRLAHSMIRRFRRGMYLSTVDFHTGTSITSYIDSRLAARDGRPFLSRAVLDLPAPEDHAGAVVRALRPNATLVAFSPSISQVAALAAWSTRTGQPLRLDRVAELPNSSSAEYGVLESEGGRAWNVKTVVPKEGAEPVQVMRPRVGDKIAGGGFVAVLRRVADEDGAAQVEEADEDGRE